jgi:hypothetical protein
MKDKNKSTTTVIKIKTKSWTIKYTMKASKGTRNSEELKT